MRARRELNHSREREIDLDQGGFMHSFFAALLLVVSSIVFTVHSASAQPLSGTNHCAEYETREPRYLEAIRAVAAHAMYGFEEMCTLPTIWDIEAQPDRVVTRDGDVIPHITVQLHREFDSCLYKVRDADKVITSSRCYSGF